MRKIFTLFCFAFLIGYTASAQQDPMFTKYMFNSLIFNPAYAGRLGFSQGPRSG